VKDTTAARGRSASTRPFERKQGRLTPVGGGGLAMAARSRLAAPVERELAGENTTDTNN
jgi:hypothetical protein